MIGGKQLAFEKSRPDSDAGGEAVNGVIAPKALVDEHSAECVKTNGL
jgi:hypothetical protein